MNIYQNYDNIKFEGFGEASCMYNITKNDLLTRIYDPVSEQKYFRNHNKHHLTAYNYDGDESTAVFTLFES